MSDKSYPASFETLVAGRTPLENKQDHSIGPYYINLRNGKFAQTDHYSTTRKDVDRIFDGLETLANNAEPGRPLRLMMWAHGGLVSETAAIAQVRMDANFWRQNGIYPLFFVWQTGLLETIRDLFLPKLNLELLWSDDLIEKIARISARGVWSEMKVNAQNGSLKGAGALYVAQKLKALMDGYPGKIELHAIGHSAGAIFHSFFLPAVLAQGKDIEFKSAQLLAPAINIPDFRRSYTDGLKSGKVVEMRVFAMRNSLELADPSCHPYQKSLLYLIYKALEKKIDTDLLGMEISIIKNADLKDLIKFIYSQTNNGLRDSRSQATTHGGFHTDPTTMESLARRILLLSEKNELNVHYPSACF